MRVARAAIDRRSMWVILEGDIAHEIAGVPFSPEGRERIGRSFPLSEVALLAPLAPRAMLGVGINFLEHVQFHSEQWHGRESAMPASPSPTLKPITSLTDPGAEIELPDEGADVVYEAECVAIVGEPCRNVSVEQAEARIFGYTCGNDLHHLAWNRDDLSVWRAKGFPGFSPVGPWIDTDFDPAGAGATLDLYVDDVLESSAPLSEMVFSFAEAIAAISKYVPLLPGDAIWSGTRDSVPARPGQTVAVEIPGIGRLENRTAGSAATS